ncbi:MAG TPA: hypothetical protein VF183_04635 [Acidimicrobiales bacterium]
MSVLHTLLRMHAMPIIAPVLTASATRLLSRAQRVFHRMPVTLVDPSPGRVLVVAHTRTTRCSERVAP